MSIPPLAFKIAVQLIQEQMLPQAMEAADTPTPGDESAPSAQWDGTALSLLGKKNPAATTTEPAPKVVTDTGSKLR